MKNSVFRKEEEPPRSRLEGWLERKLQAGALRTLPRYYPPRSRQGECAEHYAQTLLAGLRSIRDDALTLERIKDDGRAFRSWTELVLPGASSRGGHDRGIRLTPGFLL
jgi:hypothetical protein